MMASRLVKSCLFMLVALAPVAAKASFVIDTFNGSQGTGYTEPSVYTLANGLTVRRTTLAQGGTFAYTGTSVVFTQTGDPDAGNVRFRSFYSFSNTVGSVDNLGSTPSLDLKFNSVTGSDWNANFTWYSDDNFMNSIGSVTTALSPSAGTLFTSTAATLSFLSARSLRLTVFRTDGLGGSFDLSNVTATPEPTTLLMFSAVAGVGYAVRRRRKNSVIV